MKNLNRKALLGLALVIIPGSGVIYGLYLIYKASKKKPKTYEQWIKEMYEEASKSVNK